MVGYGEQRAREYPMSKRTSKRASRKKKGANHGKRPNGN
jgi:hypothetical protein